jgi:hypothetical protein
MKAVKKARTNKSQKASMKSVKAFSHCRAFYRSHFCFASVFAAVCVYRGRKCAFNILFLSLLLIVVDIVYSQDAPIDDE